jgi:hypothetical protein
MKKVLPEGRKTPCLDYGRRPRYSEGHRLGFRNKIMTDHRFFRRLFFGDLAIRDYATVRVEDEIRERVYLKTAGKRIDISQIHWPLALKPFIFGVWAEKNGALSAFDEKEPHWIYFGDKSKQDRQWDHGEIASIQLEFFDRVEQEEGSLLLLKIRKSRIHHLPFIKMAFLFSRYYKIPVLSFDQFNSFVSAYSYPRIVKLISFMEAGYYNIFPMDLLGEIPGTNKSVFGLRHTNVTLPRIIQTRKLVVSEFSSREKDPVYQLGKHHGGDPPAIDSLPFKVVQSRVFGFPIPIWAESYKEISIFKTMNLGSHMLLLGKSENQNNAQKPGGHLFHIHFLLYLLYRRKGLTYPLA